MTRKFATTMALAMTFAASAAFAQANPATTGDAAAAPATPATNATGVTKIAIVNIQQAIVNTNEGKRDFDALGKKYDPKQAELKSQNDEIERLKKDLSAQTATLSEDERSKRVQAIETKQKSLQRNLEDAQNSFQQESNELANRIGQKMLEVVDKYARQNGIGVVLDVSGQNSNVLWGSEQSNITAAVVQAYNAASGVAAPPASAPRPQGTTRPSGTTTRPSTGTKPSGPPPTPKQ